MNYMNDSQLEMILDHMFDDCDNNKFGLITISQLSSYIKNEMKLELSIKESFLEVIRPYDKYHELDKISFKAIFHEFVKQSRDFDNFAKNEGNYEEFTYDSTCNDDFSSSSLSLDNSSSFSKVNSLELDELQCKVDQLEFKNGKLMEEKVQLVNQLHGLEDAYALVTCDLKNYESSLSLLHLDLNKNQNVTKLLSTEKSNLETKILELNKTINMNKEELKLQAKKYLEDVEFANANFYKTKNQLSQMQIENLESKKKYEKLLREKDIEIEYITNDFLQLKNLNENLSDKNEKLKEKLEEKEFILRKQVLEYENLKDRLEAAEARQCSNTNASNSNQTNTKDEDAMGEEEGKYECYDDASKATNEPNNHSIMHEILNIISSSNSPLSRKDLKEDDLYKSSFHYVENLKIENDFLKASYDENLVLLKNKCNELKEIKEKYEAQLETLDQFNNADSNKIKDFDNSVNESNGNKVFQLFGIWMMVLMSLFFIALCSNIDILQKKFSSSLELRHNSKPI